MRRTPIVLGGTLAGLIGVLTFHTSPARTSFTTVSGAGGSTGGSVTSPGGSVAPSAVPGRTVPGRTVPGRTHSARSSAEASPSASPKASAGTSQAAATRTATGASVNYGYGILSVQVSVSGKRIVHVGIASIQDGGNPRSVMIDQQSIPILEQEALQAQSANIQGVSGASYTSGGFVQSLQSALHSLGL